MKKLFLFFLGTIIFLSCEKKEEKVECFKEDPFEVEWLKEAKQKFILDTFEYDLPQSIVMYTYQNEKVFSLSDCAGCVDVPFVVLNCEQKEICVSGGLIGANTCTDFYDNYTDKKIIYTE